VIETQSLEVLMLNCVFASSQNTLFCFVGVYVTIVGEPNVGKSSLLNYLLKRPAAIVSSTAGTTRSLFFILDLKCHRFFKMTVVKIRDSTKHGRD